MTKTLVAFMNRTANVIGQCFKSATDNSMLNTNEVTVRLKVRTPESFDVRGDRQDVKLHSKKSPVH